MTRQTICPLCGKVESECKCGEDEVGYIPVMIVAN